MSDFQDLTEPFQPDASLSLAEDMLVDVISLDGRILWLNELQAELLGAYDRDLAGYDAAAFYTVESFAEIRQLLRHRSRAEHASTIDLTLLGAGGRPIRTLARARFIRFQGEPALRLAKLDYGPVGNHYRRLEDDVRMLKSMVETSNEAHWSIAFIEPVDTTLPRADVVQQVFENQSVWRMCNPAMARIYQLPETMDFNEQDVRLYWPRSAANEQFVEEIINSNYAIDDALSVDRRHDGTLQYILNDVARRDRRRLPAPALGQLPRCDRTAQGRRPAGERLQAHQPGAGWSARCGDGGGCRRPHRVPQQGLCRHLCRKPHAGSAGSGPLPHPATDKRLVPSGQCRRPRQCTADRHSQPQDHRTGGRGLDGSDPSRARRRCAATHHPPTEKALIVITPGDIPQFYLGVRGAETLTREAWEQNLQSAAFRAFANLLTDVLIIVDPDDVRRLPEHRRRTGSTPFPAV